MLDDDDMTSNDLYHPETLLERYKNKTPMKYDQGQTTSDNQPSEDTSHLEEESALKEAALAREAFEAAQLAEQQKL